MRDQADLERYCYFVAGTVGELLTELFAAAHPVSAEVRRELEARSVSFGLGLQLVNILKDVAEDLERGDCFLPHSTARSRGVPLERLLDPATRARGLAVVRAVSAEARRHLERARAYTLLWPAEGAGLSVRRFCAVPLALALATLREVELGDDALVPNRAPTVTRALVLQVFADAALATREGLAAGQSSALLEQLFERARRARLERPTRPTLTPPAPRR
jgi:farnesyl-diphosphate farnesyltransferase